MLAGRGDLGYWFRTQEPRTLDDVDLLLQRNEQLRTSIGHERAETIAKAPEDFADAEIFRVYHAKARFRTIWQTSLIALAGLSVAAPMMNQASGRALARSQSLILGPAILGTAIVLYNINVRWVGWTAQQQNEFNFARNIRMLRNVQIKM